MKFPDGHLRKTVTMNRQDFYNEYQASMAVLIQAYNTLKQENITKQDRQVLRLRYYKWKKALRQVMRDKIQAAKTLYYLQTGVKYD